MILPRLARAFVAAALLAAGGSVAGQAPLRTPWGDPDLQGLWPSGALIDVPFERPAQFGLRAQLTDDEFAALALQVQRQSAAAT